MRSTFLPLAFLVLFGSTPFAFAQSPATDSVPTATAEPSPLKGTTQKPRKPKPAVAGSPAPAASPAPSQTTRAQRKAAGAAANKPLAAQTPGGGPGMVWVNTKSKVYHVQASKWYGRTKHGKYMTEADAKAAGNHPAPGKE